MFIPLIWEEEKEMIEKEKKREIERTKLRENLNMNKNKIISDIK